MNPSPPTTSSNQPIRPSFNRDFSKYIGVPFVDNGRTLERGCDCWGLARLIWQNEFGFFIPSNLGNYAVSDVASMSRTVTQNLPAWKEVPLEEAIPGDGVLMRLKAIPVHVGVVIEKGSMIHTHIGINSVLVKYTAIRWARRVVGVYRYAG